MKLANFRTDSIEIIIASFSRVSSEKLLKALSRLKCFG